MTNLSVVLIQFIEGPYFEEQHDISVLLLDLPILFLRVCKQAYL